jgi:photosystem II stability/assembly factor-like uncharacterized protein
LRTTQVGNRARAAGRALTVALLLAGCQEAVYEKKFGPGDIDVYDDLYSATAVKDTHAWAAGYFGSIYRTTDGGAVWRKLDSQTDRSIYGISFADEKNGWAVGRRGFIIHTSDGGDTWDLQETPRKPAQHLFSVHAIDANHAWIVGEWGGRYATADGGKTWQDLSFLVDETHPSFAYLTEFELEKFRQGERIYDDLFFNDILFVDSTHGWMIGEYGKIYRTEDGGANWTEAEILGDVRLDPIEFPKLEKEIPRELWPQLFKAAEQLQEKEFLRIAIQGYLTEAELRAKGGETVLADERAEAVRDFLEGEGISQERIRVIGTTPLDQETVDMAAFARSKVREKAIVEIEVLETPFLFDVAFNDRDHGVIAGLGGVILHSEDGGKTWRYSQSDSRQAFFSIGIGRAAVVAVGEKGLRRVSLDGGQTFQDPEKGFPPLFTFMRDLRFGNGETGWVVGAAGTILRSTNGGLEWQQVLPPPKGGVPDDGLGE